jgi:hypothetical protein
MTPRPFSDAPRSLSSRKARRRRGLRSTTLLSRRAGPSPPLYEPLFDTLSWALGCEPNGAGGRLSRHAGRVRIGKGGYRVYSPSTEGVMVGRDLAYWVVVLALLAVVAWLKCR